MLRGHGWRLLWVASFPDSIWVEAGIWPGNKAQPVGTVGGFQNRHGMSWDDMGMT